jgi:hypothetical protein
MGGDFSPQVALARARFYRLKPVPSNTDEVFAIDKE